MLGIHHSDDSGLELGELGIINCLGNAQTRDRIDTEYAVRNFSKSRLSLEVR